MHSPTIPPNLKSTFVLLQRAFPDGVSRTEVLPLIKVLYEHISDRNLVEVVRLVALEPKEVHLNKVYEAVLLDEHDETVDAIKAHLECFGFEGWTQETS